MLMIDVPLGVNVVILIAIQNLIKEYEKMKARLTND